MRSAATALILIALLAGPASADDDNDRKSRKRGDRGNSSIGRIFGDRDRNQRDDDRRSRVGRDDDDDDGDDDDDDDDDNRGRRRMQRTEDRARRDQIRDVRERGPVLPRRDRNPGSGYQRVPFDNGYQDGLIKGREDALDNRSSDPATHGWYRTGDRGYNSRYGSRDQYRSAYREGFLSGYREAYRGAAGGRDTRRPSWWPF